jgi:hypothetical protein
LKAEGAPLLDASPQPGAGGARVAFVHPKGVHGVLLELRQGPKSCWRCWFSHPRSLPPSPPELLTEALAPRPHSRRGRLPEARSRRR